MAWSCSEEPQAAQLHEVKVVICAMQGSGTTEDCNESKGHFIAFRVAGEFQLWI